MVLTIGTNDIQLSLSKQAVTEIENVAGLGQGIASLVGAILALAEVPLGPQITAVVAARSRSLSTRCPPAQGFPSPADPDTTANAP